MLDCILLPDEISTTLLARCDVCLLPIDDSNTKGSTPASEALQFTTK
jgi:hypothetical protein